MVRFCFVLFCFSFFLKIIYLDACFCDRDCFGKFLKEHGLKHAKLCKLTSLSRQLVDDVRTSRKAPTIAQVVRVVDEVKKIFDLLENDKQSKQDELMVELALCESLIMFGFDDIDHE